MNQITAGPGSFNDQSHQRPPVNRALALDALRGLAILAMLLMAIIVSVLTRRKIFW